MLSFLSIVSQKLLKDISIIVAFRQLNIKWIIRIIICILYIISSGLAVVNTLILELKMMIKSLI